MANYNGNTGANLCEELTKENQRILNRIAKVPNGGVQNVTHSLDLSGLNPIQVTCAINTINNFKLRNQESEELKRQNADADNLINLKKERNRDIDREIQKLKEIAEQQQRQEEESNDAEKRFQQLINDCKVRMGETKLEHDRVSADLLKYGESTKNDEAQISEKARELTERKEELERLREQVKCQKSTKKELLEEERKMQENVEKADLEIKELANERVTISSNLSMHGVTIKELEQQIKEHPEKLKEARKDRSSTSAESAEVTEKLSKLQSEYDKMQRLQTQKSEQLITLMNIHELGRQLASSIDTSAEDDGDDDDIAMNNDMISKVVELFQKLQRPFKEKRAEQRKRRWNNEEVPSVPTKEAKESDTTSSSANIPVTDGVQVANAQPVEADPQVQPLPVEADPRVQPLPEHRVLNADVAPAAKESAPVQASNNVQAVLQLGEIRLLPQNQAQVVAPPPSRHFGSHRPRHNYGSAHGYSHGYFTPMSQPVYPRYGSGYNSPRMPAPTSLNHNNRRQPPPLPPNARPHYQNYRRSNNN